MIIQSSREKFKSDKPPELEVKRRAARLKLSINFITEAEGLEPPSAFARRFSRPLTYQLAYASTRML
jgi:hypothetical protein